MKSKRYFLVLLFFAGLFLHGFAAKVESVDAKRAAQQFMTDRMQLFASASISNLEVAQMIERYHDGVLAYYAINFSEGGFVILAADDQLKPVIGYAYQGSYSEDYQPENYSAFMSQKAEEAVMAIQAQLEADVRISQEWSRLLDPDNNPLPEVIPMAEVLPLLSSSWNQDYPYNALCPPDQGGSGGYTYAGCVATAMSIIMHYWRYPLQGIGEKTHYSSYGPLYVNFGATNYNWDAMQNIINTQSGNSIYYGAQLQYHCGVSVNMQYGPDGSGAQSTAVPGAIKTYFGYSTTAQYVTRMSYSYDAWKDLLKSQLNLGYPLYYSGYPATGSGHAWNTDGYQEQVDDVYFHENWGWGGSFNGYYTLLNMNPGGDAPFSNGQAAIINFIPPSSSYPYNCSGNPKIITTQKGSLDDGSGPLAHYQNNNNCEYLIAPADSANTITLSFVKFDTQPNDILTIYDGENDSAPVLGTFSGSDLPSAVTSTGNRMFLKFTSDASGASQGWLAEFNSTLPQFCGGGIVNIIEPTGTLTDGSSEHKYNNNSLCRWRIQPPAASDITLNFTAFETEDVKDFVQVYNMNNNQLLGEYSGNALPPSITVPGPNAKAYIVFRSSHFTTAQGWEFDWTIGNVGLNENDAFESLSLYPNPANDMLNVAFSVKEKQDVTIRLSAMNGKIVYTEQINNFMGKYQRVIDAKTFSPGVYVLSLISDKGTTNQKVVIE